MNKPVLKLGQTLYSLNVGNAARYAEQKLTPVEVIKIGRKYFICAPFGERRPETVYHIDTWHEKTEFSLRSKLYVGPQEWEDEKEAIEINQVLRSFFNNVYLPKLSLDKLRKIQEIINS